MRVVWKSETMLGNVEIGPVLVSTRDADDEHAVLGRPYQRVCICDEQTDKRQRSTERNEWGYPLCPDCGDELSPPWVTRDEALAIAAEHDVELEES